MINNQHTIINLSFLRNKILTIEDVYDFSQKEGK